MYSVSLLRAAGRIAGRYLAMLPSHPERTKRFGGTLLRYIAAYDHIVNDPPYLPSSPLHEIFSGIDAQQVCLQHRYEYRTLGYAEAYVLAAIMTYLRPGKVFEIGTFTGAGTLLIAQQGGPDCAVYTLDLPPDDKQLLLPNVKGDAPEMDAYRIGVRFRDNEYARQITQLYGDSAEFDFSPYTGQMDLVFVDGAHSYEYAINDTRKALKMLSPRGTIIWDDCSISYPGVVRALNKFGATIPIYRIAETRLALYTRQS